MKSKIFIAILLSSNFITILLAQTSNSIYSSYGIGNMHSLAIGQLEGLGNSGIGLRSPNFINTLNPAANVYMQKPVTAMLDLGVNFDLDRAYDGKNSNFESGGSLSHLALWMQPNRRWGTIIGMLPYSEVAYDVSATRIDGATQTPYSIIYKGSGGIYKVFWGNAFAISEQFSVGINTSVLFGSIKRTEEFSSDDVLGDFSTEKKTNLIDYQVDIGLQYAFRLSGNQFVLGATFTPGSDMKALEETWLRKSLSEEIEKEDVTAGAYRLPLQAGFGISWNNKRWLITSDVKYQNWENADISSQNTLQNTLKWSLGTEWSPLEQTDYFYQQPLSFRAGAFLQNYHQIVEGQRFPVWGLTAGASIPLRRRYHHVTFNYIFQNMGTLSEGLLIESKHRISLNIHLRDIWFLQKKFD
ncbi:MAG: hypothetical protein SFU99_03040 [Saprospiraceae bacterium]|nr:hypothetical protein [Saprospiraceae bacterium]